MADGRVQEQGVFISYRRADTRADAGRLYDRLAARFGPSNVFMDIDDIAPGQDFHTVLRNTLDTCQALLVLIGPGWLNASDEDGRLRLEDSEDFVRQEVSTALSRGIPVIPVLFNRAVTPAATELPEDLRDLASRQALEVSDTRFHEDVNALVQTLEPLLSKQSSSASPRRALVGLVATLALVAVIGGWWVASMERAPDEVPVEAAGGAALRAEPAAISRAGLLALLQRLDLFDARNNRAGRGADPTLEIMMVGEDSVVVARDLGLMWQQNGTEGQHTYERVQQQLQALNDRRFAGHADWRLPTLEEAMSLLTPEEKTGAHVSPMLSPRQTPVFWTADRAGEDAHWVVYAFDGTAAPESPEFNAWLRAVRRLD